MMLRDPVWVLAPISLPICPLLLHNETCERCVMTLHQLLLKTGQLAFQLNINVVLHTDLGPFVRVGDFAPTPTLATV